MPPPTQPGLQHLPQASRSALRLSPARSGIFARGRTDLAAAPSTGTEAQSLLKLGLQHLHGRGLPKNDTEAARCFQQAADLGLSEAQYRLALLYDTGRGVPLDHTFAAHWDRRAADQNHAYAQASLSYRYNVGEGVLQSFTDSFTWCQRAAENNLAWAQCNLGLMYRKGEGTPRNGELAALWYQRAADQDFPDAQLELGLIAYTARDLTRAAHYLHKAADQNNATAQFHLAHLYETGQGVPQDYVLARYWLRKSAEQGHEQALRDLKRREYRDPEPPLR
jgi:TPR repeat protein